MANQQRIVELKGDVLYMIERILNRQLTPRNKFTKEDVLSLSERYLFREAFIENLENQGLIEYSDGFVYITQLAKNSLDIKFKHERNLIEKYILDDYEFAFLQFMHNRNEPVNVIHFPLEFEYYSKNHWEMVDNDPSHRYWWMDEVSKYVKHEGNGFILNQLGENTFKKKSEDYALEIERKNLEMQKLRGDVEILSNQLLDYDKVKTRARDANRIAIIAIFLAAIGLVLQWLLDKSD